MHPAVKVIAVVVCLGGCVAAPPPPPVQITPENFCSEGLNLLGSPYIEPFQKAALLEAMRNRRCMG